MTCEYCDEKHEGTYGSGRFCSEQCARGFSTKNKREKINKKVSEQMKKYPDRFCSVCGEKIAHTSNNKSGVCRDCSRRLCNVCGIELNEDNAYKHNSYCKTCFIAYTTKRFIERKKKAIEYKGGKCELCGYNKYYGALEFHHIDPNKKEFEGDAFRKYAWEKVIIELDKCALLCSNCHREVHAGIEQLDRSEVS